MVYLIMPSIDLFQENAGYIVMLCELVELGKKKCERYIPPGVGDVELYGGTLIYRIHSDYRLIKISK